jgi:hypothetical protein
MHSVPGPESRDLRSTLKGHEPDVTIRAVQTSVYDAFARYVATRSGASDPGDRADGIGQIAERLPNPWVAAFARHHRTKGATWLR